jgi:glycerophosphoryl diester phosphodiesterase
VLELVRGDSTASELAVTAPLIRAYAHGVTIPDHLATKRMVSVLRALRLSSWVYTINDTHRARALDDIGVSGIFSDMRTVLQ